MIGRTTAQVSLSPNAHEAAAGFTVRWPVRQYELDRFGHVNNAVYLNWFEQAATDHAEAIGFGHAWAEAQDRAWVVREHRITCRRPLIYGDVVLVAEAVTEWTWIRASDGRPARLPSDLLDYFRLL